MSENRIVLYKQRDFSQKMNVTIDYIRQNFGGLVKPLLVVVIPGVVLSVLLNGLAMKEMGSLGDPTVNQFDFINQIGSMSKYSTLASAIQMVLYAMVFSVIFTYMKEKDAGSLCEPKEILQKSMKYVLGIIGLMILESIVIVIGTIFFIIPGIFLAITLSISIPIFIFEDCAVSDAFGKSFRLIKNKWWSTFGLLVISGIIALVITFIFAIPTYAMTFGEMFSMIKEQKTDTSGLIDSFTSWYGSLSLAFTSIGQHIAYLIPTIALAFQYFNLSERMEGTGLKSQIESFENLG